MGYDNMAVCFLPSLVTCPEVLLSETIEVAKQVFVDDF